MSSWVKNGIMITVLLVWTVVMLTQLYRRMTPEVTMWGIPGALYVILNPSVLPIRRASPDEVRNGH